MNEVRKVWAPCSDELDNDEMKCCLIYANPNSGFYDEELAIMPWESWVRVLDLARKVCDWERWVEDGPEEDDVENLVDALHKVAGEPCETCHGFGKVLGGPCNVDGEVCDDCKGTGSRRTG